MEMKLFTENENYDVVIDGTGLVESIVSAALSISCRRVLHLDRRDFYGGSTPSMSLSQLRNFCECSVDDSLVAFDRKFLIDAHLRLMFANDEPVDAIVKAGLSDHLSFLPVKKVQWYQNGSYHPVPLSKSDIFQSHMLTLVEKRTLMKFLTMNFSGVSLSLQSAAAVGHDRYHSAPELQAEDPRIGSWSDLLSPLSENLKKMINYGIKFSIH